MADGQTLLAFLIAAAAFAYVPGPAMLYTASRTIGAGRASGLSALAGIHLGGYIHVLLAASGLTALLTLVPPLYLAMKLAGALYLAWLGIGMIRRALAGGGDTAGAAAASRHPALWESALVEILNPKTALFFYALLPQFVDAAASWPVWVQLLTLGTIVNLMFSSADLACVLFAGGIVRRAWRSRRGAQLFQALGGTVLIGLGARLALARQT